MTMDVETTIIPHTHVTELPGRRMLILAPHPDDEIFGCGGAIVRHLGKGGSVKVVIFTDGGYLAPDGSRSGYHAPVDDRSSYIHRRRFESLEAARVLGYGEPTFRGHGDRSLHYNETLISEIIATVRESAADLVCAPSVMEMHPDHRSLAMATTEALRRIEEPILLAMYEVGVPLQPNLLLDISAVAEKKREAMRCFASQLEKQRYDHHIAGLNVFRSYTLPAEVTCAEAFVVVPSATLRSDFFSVYRPWYSVQQARGVPTVPSDLPLCSVLIRSMNRKTLEEALDSVALQTWPNLEIVIVNATGGEHAPVGENCGPFPIRIIQPGKPVDRAGAANLALGAAQGSYLLFLDDDDLILPHHIARLMKEFKSSPSLKAAYAGVICTNQDGVTVKQLSEPFDPSTLRLQNFLPIHSVLFQRDALAGGLRFDESFAVCEDWDFWLQILERWGAAAFRFVPETGAVYRMFEDGRSGVWSEPERTRLVMLRIYRKWLGIWGDDALWSLLELGRYKNLYHERNAEFAELSSRMKPLQERLLVMELESSRDRDRVIRTETALKDLRDHGAGLLDAIRSLQEAIEERDRRLNSLYQSRSWRITRPLRAVATLLTNREARPTGGHIQSKEIEPCGATEIKSESLRTVEPTSESGVDSPIHSFSPGHRTYDYAVDLESESAGTFVFQMVGNNRRVLEVGCGPGSITRLLAEQAGCRVTGLEFDSTSIEKARPYCEHIYQTDLNAADWPATIADAEPFDVVVAADVLEHLYDPWRTLRQLRPWVNNDGSLVLSLPHAGHAALVASFLSGNIAYRDWGLLDRTHIRFFGLRDIEALVSQAGFKIVQACYVTRSPENSELAANWLAVPELVRKTLRSMPNTEIYQVVLRAVPIESEAEAISLGHTERAGVVAA